MGLLEGKNIVITGVLTDASLAFGVAKLAIDEGANVMLTGAGRALSLTERTARKLPAPAPVYELDVTVPNTLSGPDGSFELPAYVTGDQYLVVQKGQFRRVRQVSVVEGTQPVDAGFMANAWVRLRHPDYDTLREMMDVIGRTVKVHAG